MNNQSRPNTLAAVVLCGGRSTRMGFPKANLPFGSQSMLRRVTDRIQAAGLETIILAAAVGQVLPDDASDQLQVVRDSKPEQGPLEAIRGALRAAASHDAALVVGCDAPFLAPELIRHLISRLETFEIVVTEEERFVHPLNAIYRTELADRAEQLLANGQMRPLSLIEQSHTLRIPVEQLQPFDPELGSFTNMNRPEDYFAALARAGLEPPESIVKQLEANNDRDQE